MQPQGGTSAYEVARVDAGVAGKFERQSFVSGKIVEHAGQKLRLSRLVTDPGWIETGQGKEAPEPFVVFGKEGKRLNGQHFRVFAA